MIRGISMTLNDLTIDEVNAISVIVSALRSGKVVDVRVSGEAHEHGDSCATGQCEVPVPIESPYRAVKQETVDATYEVDEKPKPKKVGKKRAAKVTEATDEAKTVVGTADAAPPPAPAPAPTPPAFTKVDVDNALAEVARKGMTVVKSLLSEFASARTRDLPETRYAEFITRANEISSR